MAWPGLGLPQGDAAEAVAELKRRPGLEPPVHGSGDLVSPSPGTTSSTSTGC